MVLMAGPTRHRSAPLVRVSGAYKFCPAALAFVLAACAVPQPESRPMAQAHESIEQAQAQSARAQRAAEELQRSVQALEREKRIAQEQAAAADAARAEAERHAQELALANENARAYDLATELKRLQGQVEELEARQTERGWVLTLRNGAIFDADGAALKPAGRRAMDSLARFMRRMPEPDIAIEGFTDAQGAPEANRRLSEARAASVKRALVSRGVEASRLDTRGYGPAFPVASNGTPSGRQLNRRVEIVLNPS
jgi:outer membrane protein OmpA-like peptidoglycan-associated protein